MKEQIYYIYILTNNHHTVFYVGMTSNLQRRYRQHLKGAYKRSFTNHYNIRKLVHFEIFASPVDAIEREKKVKKWRREKKLDLIRQKNPEMRNLFVDEGDLST